MADRAPPIITFQHFAALDGDALYDMLKLRFDIFVVEQQSLYPELDGIDKSAVHSRALIDGGVVATLRLVGLDGSGPVRIGRVAVRADQRGTGLGQQIMSATLDHIDQTDPRRDVTLGAQLHLERFYASFGFVRCSDIYDDGGIDHVDMIRTPANVG